jgi:protein-S-isoprenylcysteine O-methyltransferase Ste14
MSIVNQPAAANGESRVAGGITLEVCSKILMTFLFLRFAVINGSSLAVAFRLSTLLLISKLLLDSYFTVMRRYAQEISTSPFDWVVGFAGTYLVMFYETVDGRDHVVPQGIQIVGMVMQILALCSLNTSFGTVAANRGVKTQGLYKYIWHPLYSAYVVSYLGFVINHPRPWNLMLYAAQFVFFFLRAKVEERLLLRCEEYRAYASQVRWRLIPFIV